MAQQPQNNPRRFIPILLIYLAFFVYMQFFMKPQPTPQQSQSLIQQAQALENEGRNEKSGLSMADRVKKLTGAIDRYEQIVKAGGKSEEAIRARFRQVDLYDYLAALEGKRSGTHWYDQAEMKLKEMETGFHGKQAEVKLARHTPGPDGTIQVREETVAGRDLGQVATARLNEIRMAREGVRQEQLTWQILNVLVMMTGGTPYSYFFALLFVVVFLKTITWPFQKRQYKYFQDMAKVQPLVKQAQEEMKGRPQEEINRRVMQIYQEQGVNLAGGCLPMLVTGFALFPVYWMVRDYEYQFTKAQFLWVGSPLSKTSPWIADNLAQFDVPMFVIYNISMVGSMMLQPKQADPQQAQQQKIMMIMMPLVFGVMMWMYQWSSAFMLYWLVLNIVSIYQSWLLNRRYSIAPGTGSSGGGGGTAVPTPPPAPLAPMKGVKTKSANNGRSGKPKSSGLPGTVKPKGSGGPR